MARLPHRPLLFLLTLAPLAAFTGCGGCGDREQPATEPDETEATEESAERDTSHYALAVDGQMVLDVDTLAERVQDMVDRYERVADRPETTPRWRNQRRRRIVQDALHDYLIALEVQGQGIVVTEEQLDQDLSEELGRMFDDRRLFERYLASREISEEEFRAQRRKDLAERLVLAQRGSLDPTDEELQAFYEENIERWHAEQRVHASTITARVLRGGGTEEEQDAERRIREIRSRIVDGGEDFAEVAREVSAGIERPRGGDMGWIVRNEHLRAQLVADGVDQLLFTLPVGEVSAPLRTQLGYQIFLVHDRRDAGTRGLDEVRDNLLRPLRRQVRQRLRHELVRDVEDSVEVEYFEDNWGLEPE